MVGAGLPLRRFSRFRPHAAQDHRAVDERVRGLLRDHRQLAGLQNLRLFPESSTPALALCGTKNARKAGFLAPVLARGFAPESLNRA